MPQDMPPVGGYGPIQYKRNLPFRGFRPRTYLLAMTVVMGYGWYQLVKEDVGAYPYSPLLQAEEDRDQVRRHLADQAREKELLGENLPVYNTNRFVRPTFAATPGNLTK
ncbi:unnamed protein product [Parascedosporium putredinis]|uniref:NADH dehydrogenase [ubiquinone] 1 alpha subcomplex subunit 13 n=1 Tax=Parascedosporium putredinis TaxID=1442378 RepID=A0A9P1GX96_9PEZI|nr:unnamed protein product [Parascedosporium putredinis]CAI7988979.1 unnamed protein product [Parascedosporium putredinis]